MVHVNGIFAHTGPHMLSSIQLVGLVGALALYGKDFIMQWSSPLENERWLLLYSGQCFTGNHVFPLSNDVQKQ